RRSPSPLLPCPTRRSSDLVRPCSGSASSPGRGRPPRRWRCRGWSPPGSRVRRRAVVRHRGWCFDCLACSRFHLLLSLLGTVYRGRFGGGLFVVLLFASVDGATDRDPSTGPTHTTACI